MKDLIILNDLLKSLGYDTKDMTMDKAVSLLVEVKKTIKENLNHLKTSK